MYALIRIMYLNDVQQHNSNTFSPEKANWHFRSFTVFSSHDNLLAVNFYFLHQQKPITINKKKCILSFFNLVKSLSFA